MMPAHDRRWLRWWACPSVVGLAVATGFCARVRADEVRAGGKPAETEVRVQSLRDGLLHYQLRGGHTASVRIDLVEYMQLDEWRLFNLAEKQQRDGHMRQAVITYERVLSDLAAGVVRDEGAPASRWGEIDRRLLARCRLARTCDAHGRFDRAVMIYLDVVESSSGGRAYLEPMCPKHLPATASQTVREAALLVDAVIERHGDDDVGAFLSRWRRTWPKVEAQEQKERGPTATGPAGSPGVQRAEEGLREIRQKFEAGEYDEALDMITPLQNAEAGRLCADLFYWEGRARSARNAQREGPEADKENRRAGLAFMRVVIHFPRDGRVAECLYRAGEACDRTGRRETAARLWSEVVSNYSRSRPWAELAGRALAPETVGSRATER